METTNIRLPLQCNHLSAATPVEIIITIHVAMMAVQVVLLLMKMLNMCNSSTNKSPQSLRGLTVAKQCMGMSRAWAGLSSGIFEFGKSGSKQHEKHA